MANPAVNVRSLMLPIEGAGLLLPNAAVAEIVAYREPEALRDAPEWLLGILPWRGLRLPLISLEVMLGRPLPAPETRLRIAVVNTLNGNRDLPFFALVLQGIPSLSTVNESMVSALTEDNPDTVAASVTVNGELALIPDLDAIERLLHEAPAQPT